MLSPSVFRRLEICFWGKKKIPKYIIDYVDISADSNRENSDRENSDRENSDEENFDEENSDNEKSDEKN